jgi:hypothetical protein
MWKTVFRSLYLCKVCGSLTFPLVKLNFHGICKDCFLKFQFANRSVQIIRESLGIIKKTKNPETGINRVLLIMYHLDVIEPYANAKIIDIPVSEMREFMKECYSSYLSEIEVINIKKRKKIIPPRLEDYKTLYHDKK